MMRKSTYFLLLILLTTLLPGCWTVLTYFGMMNKSVYFIITAPGIRNLAYGPQSRQILDVYFPEGERIKRPVLIFIHGGSWQYGDKSHQAVLLRPYLEQGILGVMINYRLAPQFTFPDQLEDGLLALRWVYENIERFGGDPDNLHLAGHSAGAHLSTLLALQSHRLREIGIPGTSLRSCVSLSGIYDLEGTFEKNILNSVNDFISDTPFRKEASPIFLLGGREIPTSRFFLVVTGGDDLAGWLKQGQRFYDRLRSVGVPSRFLVLEGKDHTEVLAAMGQRDSLLFQILSPLIKNGASDKLSLRHLFWLAST